MLSDRTNRARAALAQRRPPGFRNVSKMLGMYLDDVDQLVRAEDSAKAMQLAGLLPHIVAALEDPALRGSCEAADAWAAEWLPVGGSATALAAWRRHFHPGCSEGGAFSPTTQLGLKLLRLRRHPRESLASSFGGEGFEIAPERGTDLRLAYDIIAAAREWYSEAGIDDPHVQENLERLR